MNPALPHEKNAGVAVYWVTVSLTVSCFIYDCVILDFAKISRFFFLANSWTIIVNIKMTGKADFFVN